MRSTILKRAWRAFGQAHFIPQSRGVIVMVALLLAAANLSANPVVNTLGGGNPNVKPKYLGFQDGVTFNQALFHTPCGIALDTTGQYLFVADRDNNAIRYLDLVAGWTWTFDIATNLLSKPIAVAIDASYYVYVLNRGNTNNGSVITFDNWGDVIITNAVRLTNAAGMALDSVGNIYVTANSNKLIRIDAGTTNRTIVATITNAKTSLQGIVVKHNGLVAACDSGNNGIWLIDPAATNSYSKLAGFHGQGDFTTNGNNIASSTKAMFNQPMCVAEAGNGTLIVSDFGNNRVKAVLINGVVTNLYGVTLKYWGGSFPGWYDGTVYVPDSVAPNVQSRMPFGVAMAPDGSFYTTEDYYHLIRKVTGCGLPLPPPPPPAAPLDLTATATFGQVSLTWSASFGATNYNVKRAQDSAGPFTTIGHTASTSYTDTTVDNGATYYYVVSAVNNGGEGPNSTVVSATPPLPPVPDPQIGYVDFPATSSPVPYTSVFHRFSSFDFFNDALIVIKGTPGSSTFYTYGITSDPSLVPSPAIGGLQIPSDYADGITDPTLVAPYQISQVASNLVVKAIGEKADGSPNSAVVQASFRFITGNPNINGVNAAQFTISDITANAHLYYTLDGSDPSSNYRSSVDLGKVPTTTNVWTVSFSIQSNTLFKVRAFRDNYLPSGIVTNLFAVASFQPNIISFGFYYGEASSEFIASPGQIFYAPVTLTVLPNTVMDQLQFNLTVNSIGSSAALTPGAFNFRSMLMKPDLDNPGYVVQIPPYMFIGNAAPPPLPGQIVIYEGTNFVDLRTADLAHNLLAVGWLERFGQTNLFDTKKQNLLTMSLAHDDMFPTTAQPFGVIVGGYSFQVPADALPGDTYQIQIGLPSATTDGIGEPGSSVYIYAPTNGSPTNGAVNAVKIVTVGQKKYIAGDSAPFHWFNAGDFGDTNLNAPDVAQVFEAAVYGLNMPPPGTDLFDSMDSCGYTYVDNGYGYLQKNAFANPNVLFNGNDATIDTIAFGDGVLDVADIYVTYRRSQQTNLVCFRRFWTNDLAHGVSGRVAEMLPNVSHNALIKTASVVSKISQQADNTCITNQPRVVFVAGDCQTNAGSRVGIPITANIFGDKPLRMLMLNLSVVPLDGSPVLTSQVSFSANPALGAPASTLMQQRGNGNYSATWLNSDISGLSNNATIGYLYVTIPTNATSSSAYAVHFDHVSASPNGLGSFPKEARTGLITLSDRSSSSYGDRIPDSWRLRYFLTLNNWLSQTNADADGDGQINLQEYLAGTDPTDSASCFKNIGTDRAAAQKPSDCVISWPSVIGKQYVIERSSSLSAPVWSTIATNSGNGTTMEYHDATGGGIRFYRVRVQ